MWSASPNLFQAIVEQVSDGVIFSDCEGIIRVWNRGAELIFGYPAAEVVNTSMDIIIPERFRKAHWEGFHRAIQAGKTKHGDRILTTRSVHKNGSKLYVDLSFTLVRDEGKIVGVVAVARDCTERQLAAAAGRPAP